MFHDPCETQSNQGQGHGYTMRMSFYDWLQNGDHCYTRTDDVEDIAVKPHEEELVDMEYLRRTDLKVLAVPAGEEESEDGRRLGLASDADTSVPKMDELQYSYFQMCQQDVEENFNNEENEDCKDDIKVLGDAVSFQIFDIPDLMCGMNPDTLALECNEDQKPQLQFDEAELIELKPQLEFSSRRVKRIRRRSRCNIAPNPRKERKRKLQFDDVEPIAITPPQLEFSAPRVKKMRGRPRWYPPNLRNSRKDRNPRVRDVEVTSTGITTELFPTADPLPHCSQNESLRFGNCSTTLFPDYDRDLDVVKDEDEDENGAGVQVPVENVPTDRVALYTDGETCWHPPLDVFQQSAHPLPDLEYPPLKFRFYYQKLLRDLVKESLTRDAHSAIHSGFEQKCLHLGVTLGDIQLFRSNNYSIELIKDTWFGNKRPKEKVKKGRIKWFQMMPTLKQLVNDLESKIESVSEPYIKNLMNDPEVKIDWLFVSAQMLIRGSRDVSPEACKRLWNNVLSPTVILPYRWTQQDISKLKGLVKKPGKRNFYKIAKEMGKGFTPLLCLKLFAKLIRPQLEQYDYDPVEDTEELNELWNRQDVQEDFRMTMQMYNGSFACTSQWMTLAYGIEFSQQFLIQKCQKFKIGQFSLYEDCIVIVTDEIIRTHAATKYTFQDFLPWRPDRAWRNRLFALRFPHRAATGGKHNWTEGEDRLLITLARKSGKGWSWTGITKHFQNPSRNRKALQARYMILIYKLRKQTLEKFHAKQREALGTPFFFMRKALCFLGDMEKRRRMIGVNGYPNPAAVGSLLCRFRAYYRRKQRAKPSPNPYNLNKQFPLQRHLLSYLLQIPSFYVVESIRKMRGFFEEIGIVPI